jgi:hypothetical protein
VINKKDDTKVINKKDDREDDTNVMNKKDDREVDTKALNKKELPYYTYDVKDEDDSDEQYNINDYLIDDSDEDILDDEKENKYIINKDEVLKQTKNYINIVDTKDYMHCKKFDNKEEEEIIRELAEKFKTERFNPLEQSASYDNKYVLGDIILYTIEGNYYYGYIFKIRTYFIYVKNKNNDEHKIDLRFSNYMKKI